MSGLFNIDADTPAMTPLERKRMKRRAAETPKGYAALPGSGPAAETCKSCKHRVSMRQSKTWNKCGLVRDRWTHSRASDIKISAAACSRWEPA